MGSPCLRSKATLWGTCHLFPLSPELLIAKLSPGTGAAQSSQDLDQKELGGVPTPMADCLPTQINKSRLGEENIASVRHAQDRNSTEHRYLNDKPGKAQPHSTFGYSRYL